jgi:hypothetical protein
MINGGRWLFSIEGCAWATFPSVFQRRVRQKLLLNGYRGAYKGAADDTKSRCKAPPPIGASPERFLALRRRREGMPLWKTEANAKVRWFSPSEPTMYPILARSTSALAVLLDGLGFPRHQHFVAERFVCRVTHSWQRRESSRWLGNSVGSKRCRTGGVRAALPSAVDEAAGCALSVCKGRVLQVTADA